MTLADFIAGDGQSLQGALRALWLAGRGEWEQAHQTAQSDDGPEGAWVPAYLHRVEGDTANAMYWYRRARRRAPTDNLNAEWETMVRELLQQQS